MIVFLLLLTSPLLLFFNTSAKSIAQGFPYPQFCKQAASDDNLFRIFRSDQRYRDIVETLSYKQGAQFVTEIEERYPHLLQYCKKICEEDVVGGPLSYSYPKVGTCSPTILRYIKVFGDLQREFGSLKDFNIVEIGGGFGGQCKIINDISGFNSYTIIDLVECTPLIRRYLSCFPIKNTSVLNTSELNKIQDCDLVISNYAFSEIDRDGQWEYIKAFIASAPRGYMIYNHMPSVNPLKIGEFISILERLHKKVKVLHEDDTRTGDIIIWHS